MARPPNPYADPVQVSKRQVQGQTRWLVRCYPHGLVTGARKYVGTYSDRAEADQVAERLRAKLLALVATHHPGIRPENLPLSEAVTRYMDDLRKSVGDPPGTIKGRLSTARLYLLTSAATENTVAALPRFAEEIKESVEQATYIKAGQVQPKATNTKRRTRSDLAHFGAWLVANGYLEVNPFAHDPLATAERVVARRQSRRQDALERARKTSSVRDDENGEAGIGLKDVPSLDVVAALRKAVIRSATQSHTMRRATGKGSKGGPAPLPQDVAEVLAASVTLRACTGLRTCEALAIHTSRIHEDGYEIEVDRQMDRYVKWLDQPAEDLMVPPKYDKSRIAIVWPQFVPRLLDLAAYADEHSGGWLFPRSRSQICWPERYEDLIEKAIALLNAEHLAGEIDPETRQLVPAWNWHPHYLRHVYGSYSLAPVEHGGLGWPLGLVSDSMGHASQRTTESIYVHPTRTQRERARTSTVVLPGL